MPDVPLFTLVIPTRNRAHLLRLALQSALAQDFLDYEVLVSDNFSSDGTPHGFQSPTESPPTAPTESPPTTSQVVDWDTLLARRELWKAAGRTVVWTNGCFDLLHTGHVHSLRAARAFGDVLVVGVNSDDSVKRLKGAARPVFPATQRVEIVAALRCVDHVVVFDELTPEKALARLKPEVHCKGADYAPPHGRPIPEARVVASYGGRIEFLPLLYRVSTSHIIRRIQKSTRGAT